MYSKVEIYNLALGALLLNKQIVDTENDISVENKTLNLHYKSALHAALVDMDLDSTSIDLTLELVQENPNDLWSYAYKYPSKCVHFRRIKNLTRKDVKSTHIDKNIGRLGGQKVIFTDQPSAIAECILDDVELNHLSANAGLAIAYKLAILAAPLIAGKGASQLRKEIQAMYLVAKTEAQEHDRLENHTFDDEATQSEFVEARTS